MEPRPPHRHVDELRRQLRSLGYLDAGVDRFVLAGATGTRRPIAIAIRASLRTGTLAGVLLGPASTIWLHRQLPGLITGPRDALVLAIYLAILFGIGGTVAALIAGVGVSLLARLAGSAVARRGRVLSVTAGSIVTIACLAYLTLWSRQAQGIETSLPTTMVVVALAYSVIVSLLLGHAVTVTALAIVVAGTGSAPDAPGVPGASWRLAVAAGILAFCGGLLLFTIVGATQSSRGAATPLTVVSSGLRIRLFAIDGFDPHRFETLAAQGRLDALSVFASARATLDLADVRQAEVVDPARTWTTIATGQPADVHGVRGLETREVAGVRGRLSMGGQSPMGRNIRAATDLVRLTRPAITSRAERRVKTFWEVAADAGLRTAIVNWWATWPATSGTGIILSDRATLRLERGGALDGEITPAGVYERLRTAWPQLRQRAESLTNSALRDAHTKGDTAALLRRSAELDALQLVLTQEIATAEMDLVAVYLPGLDIVQHALLNTSSGTNQSASAMASRLAALEEYYVALDRLLAPVVRANSSELVLVLTAPGRVTTSASGGLTISGPSVRQATLTGTARDVAPTVLYALGVPISRELPGAPLLRLFSEEFARRFAVRYVPAYGRPSTRLAARQGQPLDQEMIDRLRSLGYVR
jgi:Type I phosphodiesterase / nucleotide pyrophosphatase